MQTRILSSITDVHQDEWNSLVPDDYPFAKHQFLLALEKSDSVSTNSGWTPRHVILEDQDGIALAMPMYEKTHSYGEYVFDWQWANAFERYGRAYYPKLLTAIPFTPATGPRILCRDSAKADGLSAELIETLRTSIQALAESGLYSSWHLLFANEKDQHALANQPNVMRRQDVQFHWHNLDPVSGEPYRDFDHFLQGFRSSKRKQIKRERRKVAEQDVDVRRVSGAQITDKDWHAFYQCYQATYLKRSGHSGYLNKDFFDFIATDLSDQCMLVSAYRNDAVIACSLFFFDQHSLYGRYWGALSDIDCLHFEACYYQGIEFAIERGLEHFNPGTQGEHKLVRGFQPTKTHSFHWVADPEFARAIGDFLNRERSHTDRYKEATEQCLPFHRD